MNTKLSMTVGLITTATSTAIFTVCATAVITGVLDLVPMIVLIAAIAVTLGAAGGCLIVASLAVRALRAQMMECVRALRACEAPRPAANRSTIWRSPVDFNSRQAWTRVARRSANLRG